MFMEIIVAVRRCSITSLANNTDGERFRQSMDHVEMPHPSAHGVHLQQGTKKKWKFYTGDTTCACGRAE